MGDTSIEWGQLKGRPLGALKTAARRIGLSFEEYRRRLDDGERWCTACKAWHKRSAFDIDASRGYGLKATCRQVTRIRNRERARDPIKDLARSAVAVAVKYGRLPHANAVACTDCAHAWRPGTLRHEYDHFMGYEAAHHLSVQVVCTQCHRNREKARRG